MNLNETELLEGIQKGENWALHQLYKLNRSSIINFVLTNNGSQEEAQDILQDGVIIVYEKIKVNNLILTSSLGTYLTSVCRNLWYKKLREKGKFISDPFAEPLEEILDDEPDQQVSKLMKLLQKIDPICREILMHKYWHKYKFEQIAQKLDKTVSSLKMKSSRCIKQLFHLFHN